MIVIVGTAPRVPGSNSGDLLISRAATDLLEAVRPDTEFVYLPRTTEFDAERDVLDSAEAVVFPGFPIRDPLTPDILNFSDIGDVPAPLVPLGAGWSSQPGDYTDVRTHQYSESTTRDLRTIAANDPGFTARDRYTKIILESHGAGDSIPVVGDCAWYHLGSLNKSYHRPDTVESVIFSTPHTKRYEGQGRSVVDLLSRRYPDAELTCLLHQEPTEHESRLKDYAVDSGFECVEADGDATGLERYKHVDLHVGYRLHGHISALRYRRPSVLLAEDGRGLGFGATIPTGTFPAGERFISESSALLYEINESIVARGIRKAFRQVRLGTGGNLSGPKPALREEVNDYLDYCEKHQWYMYDQVGRQIDMTYNEVMKPFLQEQFGDSGKTK